MPVDDSNEEITDTVAGRSPRLVHTSRRRVSVQSSPPLPFPIVSKNLPASIGISSVTSTRRSISNVFIVSQDAVPLPSPSGQTARHRPPRLNVTPTVSQKALCYRASKEVISCFLVPAAVSMYLTCLRCRHHAKWTQRARPTFQEFPDLQRMVQAWWASFQRRQ